MQAKDGGLQQEEAGGEEEGEAQGQEVTLTPLRGVERVKGGDDATQELRLHRLGRLLQKYTGREIVTGHLLFFFLFFSCFIKSSFSSRI